MMFSENILQNNFAIRDFAISVQNETEPIWTLSGY